MSDPLSAFASVVTICDLAVKVAHHLEGVHNASKEMRSLRTELSHISQLLHSLRAHAEDLSKFGVVFPAFETVVSQGGPLEQFQGVLESLAARLGLGDSGSKSVVRRFIWPYQREEIKTMLSSLGRYESLFLLALGHDQTRLLAAIRDDFSASQQQVLDEIGRLAVSHEKQESRETESERQELVEWLSGPIDFLQVQSDVFNRSQSGTGTWLLESAEYTDWTTSKYRALWCSGDPGTGKTVLASIIVDDLRKRFKDEQKIGIFTVYCDYVNKDVQSVVNLLASICAQSLHLRQCSIPDKLKTLHDSYAKTKDRPKLQDIRGLLEGEIGRYDKVFVAVDALDECSSLGNKRDTFLAELAGLIKTTANIQLLMTSRPFVDILTHFPECKIMTIFAHTEDIERYAKSRLPELAKCVQRNPDLQDEIVTQISQTASGMFLLARLNFDSFLGKETPKRIRDVIKTLPEGGESLTEAYDQALDRIDEQGEGHRELGHMVLTWVVHTCTPLTVSELQHALCLVECGYLDPDAMVDPEHLTAFCAGLVTVGPDNDQVRLVHYTAYSYFENTRHKRYHDGDRIIAKACLEYIAVVCTQAGGLLCHEQMYNTDGERILETYPFLWYANRQWAFHVRESRSEGDFVELIMRIDGYEPELSPTALSIWGDEMEHWCYNVTNLMIVAFFGFETTVKTMLERGADVNAKCRKDQTALHYATAGGQPFVASLLLDHGADVNAVGAKYRTPMHEAMRILSKPMTTLLLERGAGVNTPDQHGDSAVSVVVAMWDDNSDDNDSELSSGVPQGRDGESSSWDSEDEDSSEAETDPEWNSAREMDYDSAYNSIFRALGNLGLSELKKQLWELTQVVLRHPGAELTERGQFLLELAEKGEKPY